MFASLVLLSLLSPPPSLQPSLEEPPRESNEVLSNPMASSEVAVSVTLQSTDKQEVSPMEKVTRRDRHMHTLTYTHMVIRECTHTYVHTHLPVLL